MKATPNERAKFLGATDRKLRAVKPQAWLRIALDLLEIGERRPALAAIELAAQLLRKEGT